MRRVQIAFAALVIAAAAALLARAAGAAGNPPTAPNDHLLRIGVVRVGQMYHNMQEFKKFENDFRNARNQLQQEQQKRGEELNQLMAQREQLKPGSQQWNDLRANIDLKTAEYKTSNDLAQLKLDRFRKESLIRFYQHVNEAAAAIAKEQNLDLVLADSSPEILGPDFDAIPVAQLDSVLSTRAVLFANKKADITEEVLTRVDANFAKENPTPGITATPPALINPQGTSSTNNK